MGRRRRKQNKTTPGQLLATLLGTGLLMLLNASGVGFFKSLGITLAVMFVGTIAFMILAASGAKKEEDDRRERIRKAAVASVDKHFDTLVRKRRVLAAANEYGIVNPGKWRAECSRFYTQVIEPAVAPHALDGLPEEKGKREQRIDWVIDTIIEPKISAIQAAEETKFHDAYDALMSPIEYEHFVAARLRNSGWDAQVTQAAGDQGADVIATRGSAVLVVQCKQYTKPVGNKAVQEVSAALSHYSASRAVVVATNGFTNAACALAASNRVLLLHHDDLMQLDVLLVAA